MSQRTGLRENMTEAAMLRVRIDPVLKQEAEDILAALGISATDAVRMFYQQIRIKHGIPFELRLPNEATIAAMKGAREGKGYHFDSADEARKSLGI